MAKTITSALQKELDVSIHVYVHVSKLSIQVPCALCLFAWVVVLSIYISIRSVVSVSDQCVSVVSVSIRVSGIRSVRVSGISINTCQWYQISACQWYQYQYVSVVSDQCVSVVSVSIRVSGIRSVRVGGISINTCQWYQISACQWYQYQYVSVVSDQCVSVVCTIHLQFTICICSWLK